MKKIAVVCAAGKVGACLVDEAVNRGYDVTGFARGEKRIKNPKAKEINKDLFDLTAEDLKGFDAVIDAFGAWTPETLPIHKSSLSHLCDILAGSGTRLLVVGGAGSLYVDSSRTLKVMELDTFPDAFKPLAANMGEALDRLRERDDVLWTYLSPAADFVADGARTGKIMLGGEEFFVNGGGQSAISYKDYAIAMLDEIENARHIKKRFSVIGA